MSVVNVSPLSGDGSVQTVPEQRLFASPGQCPDSSRVLAENPSHLSFGVHFWTMSTGPPAPQHTRWHSPSLMP